MIIKKVSAILLLLSVMNPALGNPIIVDIGKPVIGGESRSFLGSFQKDREYLKISNLTGDIEVVGKVYYKWEFFSEDDDDFPYPETWIDLPFYAGKGKYRKSDVFSILKNAVSSSVAKVSLVDCRLTERSKRLQKSFRNLEVWMCRYRIEFQIPNSGDFDLSFRYHQEDIHEAGMVFNFYTPLFEDGFEEDRISDSFEFAVHDEAESIVHIKGVKDYARDGNKITLTPIPGELIVLSKKQPTAGGDKKR